ncbi:hypothetical protein ABZ656_47810 [Streptomyces sp. NPDC007095]
MDRTVVPTRDHQVAEQSKNSAHPRLRGEDPRGGRHAGVVAGSPPPARG